MSHTPHELSEEFPDMSDKIHNRKKSDVHFMKLTEDYHIINRDIHRAETDVEPTDDFNLENMRKTRMRLKDEIYSILSV
jgi:uncharacterized protein YdcH (DUF465 family)